MTKPLESAEDRVDKIIPRGTEYELPEKWLTRFAELDIRKESPSSVVNFLTCPLKWFVERHSGMPQNDEINMAALVGTFVHRILEVFYSEPANLRDEDLLMETFELGWKELTEGDGSDGIMPPDVMKDFKKLQSQVFQKDAQRGRFYKLAADCLLATFDFDGDPAELEVLSNEMWVRGNRGVVRINGKIDRIIKAPGSFEIIQDYKTGKAPVVKDGIVDPLSLTFIPVGLYAWMRTRALEKNNKGNILPLQVKSVQLLYLAHLKRFTLKVTPELLHTMDILVEEVVKAMDEVADSGWIVAKPSDSKEDPPCRWCPIATVCPEWNDNDDPMKDLVAFVDDKIEAKKLLQVSSTTKG